MSTTPANARTVATRCMALAMVVLLLATSEASVAGSSAVEAPAQAPSPDIPLLPQFRRIRSNFNVSRYLTGTQRPPSSRSEPSGNFRFTCSFSHLSHNDPIVKPGKRGRAQHLHMFFGNRRANARSTWHSLRTQGNGSCQGGPVNRSAYWTPAVYTGNGKRVIIPRTISVYYKSNGMPARKIARTKPLAFGLRMIAGQDMANPRASDHFKWYCEHNQRKSKRIPRCPRGENVIVSLTFPNCWNGKADSRNHRSHMAYMKRSSHTGQLYCPRTHPTMVPQFTLGVWFRSDGRSDRWKLASDRMHGMMHPRGTTWHADWFGAWDSNVQSVWLQECIREMRNCIWGQLGNTKRMTGGYKYHGRYLRRAPQRGEVVR